MEKLLAMLEAIFPLQPDLRARLQSMLQHRELSKNAMLLKAGHVCRELCYIERGMLRCFYHYQDTEISHAFPREGDIVIATDSFFTQTPGTESIQAVEHSVLRCLSYSDLESLCREFHLFNYHARVLIQQYLLKAEQRLKDMRLLKANDRYKLLQSADADLLQRVPAKYIATYIGTTEVNLSILKSKR